MTIGPNVPINTYVNGVILRPRSDSSPVGAEWWPSEPSFVVTGPNRMVLHTGGRGLVHFTVQVLEKPPSEIDSTLLRSWEDVSEASFTVESQEWFIDGSTGDLEGVFEIPSRGMHNARVLAKGRSSNWDGYVDQTADKPIEIEVQIWPTDHPTTRLVQYKDRLTGEVHKLE